MFIAYIVSSLILLTFNAKFPTEIISFKCWHLKVELYPIETGGVTTLHSNSRSYHNKSFYHPVIIFISYFRHQLEKIILYKNEDTMINMFAILACNILDVGGQNVSITLSSRTRHDNIIVVVGKTIFSQFWYWYPLVYFYEPPFCTYCFDWPRL